MARRKRLTPPTLQAQEEQPLALRRRAPIADIAGSAAAHAALEEVSQAWAAARDSGLLVERLDSALIDADYLVRDRIGLDPDDMAALRESIAARGQQMPVEVIALHGGRYGLISGWRRLTALQQLFEETGEARFAGINCLIRTPPVASDAYIAMVEENEIRAGISFYERARIATRAAEAGVFETPRAAVSALFASVPRSKRSKINSFLQVCAALDANLQHASQISERLGLALAKLLREDDGARERLRRALRAAQAPAGVITAARELAVLEEAALKPAAAPQGAAEARPTPTPAGVTVARRGRRITLSGLGVDAALEADLTAWLTARAK